MNLIQRMIAIGAVAAASVTMGASKPSTPPSQTPAESKQAADATTGHQHHGTSTPAATAKPSAAAKPAAAKGAPARGTYTTIVGEVMDPACFLEAGVKSIGPGHFQCAIDCAKSGQTLAIYDRANDRIYFIAGELPGKNPNDPVMAYVHKKVDVSGTVYHRAGVYGIVINKVALHQEK